MENKMDMEKYIQEILKGNDFETKNKIKVFEKSFDEMLSLMMEI